MGDDYIIGFTATICFFLFAGFAVWALTRRREREALYRSEVRKRALERGLSADHYMLMIGSEEKLIRYQSRERFKIVGLVFTGLGLGLGIGFWLGGLTAEPMIAPLVLGGLGVGLLAYVWLASPPPEFGSGAWSTDAAAPAESGDEMPAAPPELPVDQK